jgi:hypothetical protein
MKTEIQHVLFYAVSTALFRNKPYTSGTGFRMIYLLFKRMKTMKTKTVLFLLPVIICCLAGCAEPATVEKPVTEPEEIPEDKPDTIAVLNGTAWKFTGYMDVETGELTEVDTMNCEKCYKIAFVTNTTAWGWSVLNSLYVTFPDTMHIHSRNIPFSDRVRVFKTNMGEGKEPSLYMNTLWDVTSYICDDREMKLFYNNQKNYMLFRLVETYEEKQQQLEEAALKGSRWKLAGFGTALSGSLENPKPEDCEECYTLTFDTNHTASGRSVTAETAIDLLDLRKYPYMNLEEPGNGDLFRWAITSSVVSFSIAPDELKLFYNYSDQYLLFKPMKQ